MGVSTFKELIVWQKSMQLCKQVYFSTQTFPKSEVYGLTSQIRRCSVSIPSNIAEGFGRGHRSEYKQFLHIAYGSGSELETQLLLALEIGYLKETEFTNLAALLKEIMKMLNKFISTLELSTRH
ncbi:MAG: four helix bundle protein [Candidatus Levyibacteriota bacterium]